MAKSPRRQNTERLPNANSLANLKANAGKGRRPGATNKLTGALKDIILQSLANVGGAAYLEAQAEKNPNAYLALVGRVLPLQVKDGGDDPQVPAKVEHLHVSE